MASTVGSSHGSNIQNECGVAGSITTWCGTPAARSLTTISSRPAANRGCALPMNRIGGVFGVT